MNPELRQILVFLVVAHLIGDFLLQTDRVARGKRRLPVLFGHALIHALATYLLCGLWDLWLLPVAVLLTHAGIDAVKARLGRAGMAAFLVDQTAHLLSLAAIAVWIGARGSVWTELWGARYIEGLLLVGGFLLTTYAGGTGIGLAVQPLLRELEQAKQSAAGDPRRIVPESRGFENGGRTIGRLERGLIFVFILTGQPTAVAFLIAAKSIFRFGELKEQQNRMEAEYILIGTLMSFGFGIVASLLTRALLAMPWG